MKRVWIVGAGFSKPLGGPLLPDLMRPEVRSRLESCYPGGPFEQNRLYSAVLFAYSWGRRFQEGRIAGWRDHPGENLWSDAEQFLSVLDTASVEGPGSPAFRTIDRILQADYPEFTPTRGGKSRSSARALAGAARRIIAGVCSDFLEGANVRSEPWQPYVEWGSRLTEKDAVITFNYDRVLETVAGAGGNLQVVHLGEKPSGGKAPVFKLHGSVDWILEGAPEDPDVPLSGDEVISAKVGSPRSFLTCKDLELAIAAPGPHKATVSKWLEPLWDQAMEVIRRAEVITFVGFRFPQSDINARKRILGAINDSRARSLAIHVVLGPNSPDLARVRTLLRFNMGERMEGRKENQHLRNQGNERLFNLIAHQLWAEDYLPIAHSPLMGEAWRISW